MKNEALLKSWALIGATKRLDELRAEIAEIEKAFPELRQSTNKPKRAAVAKSEKSGADKKNATDKPKRTMSPESREKIAVAARKRWKAYRKAKAAKA